MHRAQCALAAAALAAGVGCASHSGKPAGALPSAAVHTDFALRADLRYTPAGWPRALTADAYVPEGTGPFPAVIVVHGGGWNSRDRSDMTPVAKDLARRGFVAVNVTYRLAPEFRYPAQLEDVRAAMAWVRREARALKVDPRRIGGWGYSAGAHLVALAAVRDGPEESRLQAVVAGGTPADLPHYPESPIITRFIGRPFAQARDTWLAASPLEHVGAGDPPVFLYHGTRDKLVYVEDAHNMKSALDRAGVPNELYLVRGLGHIATFVLDWGAEEAGIDFLDRHLRAP